MDKVLAFCLFCLPVCVQSQVDTIKIMESRKQVIERWEGSISSDDSAIFKINGENVSIEEYDAHFAFLDSVDNIYMGNYCKFHFNGFLQEEGVWNSSWFIGSYKRYYFNGKLMMAGILDAKGKKIGKWSYFNDSGELKKERNYQHSKWWRAVGRPKD